MFVEVLNLSLSLSLSLSCISSKKHYRSCVSEEYKNNFLCKCNSPNDQSRSVQTKDDHY